RLTWRILPAAEFYNPAARLYAHIWNGIAIGLHTIQSLPSSAASARVLPCLREPPSRAIDLPADPCCYPTHSTRPGRKHEQEGDRQKRRTPFLRRRLAQLPLRQDCQRRRHRRLERV